MIQKKKKNQKKKKRNLDKNPSGEGKRRKEEKERIKDLIVLGRSPVPFLFFSGKAFQPVAMGLALRKKLSEGKNLGKEKPLSY